MNRCMNPHCKTEWYEVEEDIDMCPECHKTSCQKCCGWHTWDGECPFCRGTGTMNCRFGDGGEHCDGCPFSSYCDFYEEYREMDDASMYEDRLVDMMRGK